MHIHPFKQTQTRRLSLTGVLLGLTAFTGELQAQNTLPSLIKTEAQRAESRNSDIRAVNHQAKEAPKEPVKETATAPAAANTLTLHDCLCIGRERQPNIRAARVSLASAEASMRALNNIHPWTNVLRPDLPIRREQAEKGLSVAQADVLKAEQENVYDITRLYYTYIYAKQQEQTATQIIEQLEEFLKLAKGLVDAGAEPEKITPFTLSAIRAAIGQAKTMRIPATSGQPLALAALKEAMGVEQSFEFIPRDTELPVMAGTVTLDQVVALALGNRPELVQAAAGVDAFQLEITAQDKNRFGRNVATLASGSDLHSRLIPLPHRNGEYRPGALSPEMPVNLVGRRNDRVARASELSTRQCIVMEKTKNLVTLEVINAFHIWQATAERMKIAKERFEESKQLEDLSRDAVSTNPKRLETALQNQGIIAKWRSEYLEAVFEHIKALAALERITGGGVKADFPMR